MLRDLLQMTLISATPLLFAVYGGLVSELAGVINFALEGMMLAGAFGAVWGTYATGSPWLGLMIAGGFGMLIGLLHATASLVLRANQIVSSIALNLLAAGATGMLLHQVFEAYGTSPEVTSLPRFHWPAFLASWGGAGAGSAQPGIPVLVPVALLVAVAIPFFLRRTVIGWRIRACGENPEAARATGLGVETLRFGAVCAGGLLAGVGGAALAIGELSQFVENMTQGRGYLAIAALILGRWNPVAVLPAALLFGLGEALSEQLAVRWPDLSHQVFLAFPYLLCLLVLLVRKGRYQPPSALGRW